MLALILVPVMNQFILVLDDGMHRASAGLEWVLRNVFERILVDPLVEPLSDRVEVRLKAAWLKRPCPRCGKEGY